jgi:hypothetical protein
MTVFEFSNIKQRNEQPVPERGTCRTCPSSRDARLTSPASPDSRAAIRCLPSADRMEPENCLAFGCDSKQNIPRGQDSHTQQQHRALTNEHAEKINNLLLLWLCSPCGPCPLFQFHNLDGGSARRKAATYTQDNTSTE